MVLFNWTPNPLPSNFTNGVPIEAYVMVPQYIDYSDNAKIYYYSILSLPNSTVINLYDWSTQSPIDATYFGMDADYNQNLPNITPALFYSNGIFLLFCKGNIYYIRINVINKRTTNKGYIFKINVSGIRDPYKLLRISFDGYDNSVTGYYNYITDPGYGDRTRIYYGYIDFSHDSQNYYNLAFLNSMNNGLIVFDQIMNISHSNNQVIVSTCNSNNGGKMTIYYWNSFGSSSNDMLTIQTPDIPLTYSYHNNYTPSIASGNSLSNTLRPSDTLLYSNDISIDGYNYIIVTNGAVYTYNNNYFGFTESRWTTHLLNSKEIIYTSHLICNNNILSYDFNKSSLGKFTFFNYRTLKYSNNSTFIQNISNYIQDPTMNSRPAFICSAIGYPKDIPSSASSIPPQINNQLNTDSTFTRPPTDGTPLEAYILAPIYKDNFVYQYQIVSLFNKNTIITLNDYNTKNPIYSDYFNKSDNPDNSYPNITPALFYSNGIFLIFSQGAIFYIRVNLINNITNIGYIYPIDTVKRDVNIQGISFDGYDMSIMAYDDKNNIYYGSLRIPRIIYGNYDVTLSQYYNNSFTNSGLKIMNISHSNKQFIIGVCNGTDINNTMNILYFNSYLNMSSPFIYVQQNQGDPRDALTCNYNRMNPNKPLLYANDVSIDGYNNVIISSTGSYTYTGVPSNTSSFISKSWDKSSYYNNNLDYYLNYKKITYNNLNRTTYIGNSNLICNNNILAFLYDARSMGGDESGYSVTIFNYNTNVPIITYDDNYQFNTLYGMRKQNNGLEFISFAMGYARFPNPPSIPPSVLSSTSLLTSDVNRLLNTPSSNTYNIINQLSAITKNKSASVIIPIPNTLTTFFKSVYSIDMATTFSLYIATTTVNPTTGNQVLDITKIPLTNNYIIVPSLDTGDSIEIGNLIVTRGTEPNANKIFRNDTKNWQQNLQMEIMIGLNRNINIFFSGINRPPPPSIAPSIASSIAPSILSFIPPSILSFIPPSVSPSVSPFIEIAQSALTSDLNTILNTPSSTPESQQVVLEQLSTITKNKTVSVVVPAPPEIVAVFTSNPTTYPALVGSTLPLSIATTTTNTITGNQVLDLKQIPTNTNTNNIVVVPSLDAGTTIEINNSTIKRGTGINANKISINDTNIWLPVGSTINIGGLNLLLSGIGSPAVFTIITSVIPQTLLDYLFIYSHVISFIGAILYSINSIFNTNAEYIIINKNLSIVFSVYIFLCGVLSMYVWYNE